MSANARTRVELSVCSMASDRRPGDRHTGPPQRSVRGISDGLWQAAKEKAVREGGTVSAAIKEYLERWTEEQP